MEFVKHLMIATVILGLGTLFTVLSDRATVLGEFSFFIGAVGAQFWLFTWAILLRHRRLPRFDMLVASELIIALGVFSLIIGIFIAVVFALQGTRDLQGFNLEAMRPFLLPFAEGLFAAGLAPLLAAALRQIEVVKYGSSDDSASTPEDELEGLKEKFRELTAALNNFIATCERSQTTFERSATTFNRSTDTYETAAAAIQGALGQLGEIATSESRRVAVGLDKVSEKLGAYEERLSQSSREMSGLTEETRRFKAAAGEGTTLLAELHKIIESGERFIRPGS